MNKSYNDDSIKVLSDIEHVRTRPSMYISTDRPSYQMWTEIADNAVDEAMNGFASEIRFEVDFDNNHIVVEDNGRGLPQGMNKDLNKPTVYAIYQKLNAGGKYDQNSYAFSGGLHGVGSTVINALSKSLHVTTWRGDSVLDVHFEYGQDKGHHICKHDENPHGWTNGTVVSYNIDTEHSVFQDDKLSDYEDEILNKIKLLKTLMPEVSIFYQGEEIESVDFREFLQLSSDPLFDESILISTKNYIVALNWAKDNNKYTQRSYCNSIATTAGGDHVNGICNAIIDIFGQDSMYGFNIALSAKYPGVVYGGGQSKDKAVSKEMKEFLTDSFTNEFKSYLRKNPQVKEAIANLIKFKRNELNKRNNKSNVRRDRKSTFLNTLGVQGFADCNGKNPENNEMYLVEGNSAAGSAKQARDVETQAVMPLRGKVLNVETADMKYILNNKEIATIYANLDTGIFEDFNIKKLRYDKIIIFTDADEDGKNIAALLITLFMTLSPGLVEEGHLYLALPPLYGTYEGNKFIPINDIDTRDAYLAKGCSITRYKGLGEMNPEQLRVSCMDPETRQILRIDKSPECASSIKKIMGSDTSYRKILLKEAGILI